MTRTVVHVLEAFAGGTERHLLDLVKHVDEVEHVIAVPSTHLGKSTAGGIVQAQRLGATVEIVEMGRGPAPHRNAAAIRSLRAALRRFRPDVVHGHSSIGGAISRVAVTGLPTPVAYTPNALSRSPVALAVERKLRWRTDRFIAVSEGEAEFALRNRVTTPSRLSVIPNGIELDRCERPRTSLRHRLGIPADVPLVGCLGRLTWQKAPEVFVTACGRAARQLPNTHFLLVGRGPHRDRVRAALEQADLGRRFHWLSALPFAASVFHEFDLYVLPSRYEGGPYTPLEAMRAGTPVILTDVPGNANTIEDGVSGLLVGMDDANALGDAIAYLMSDESRRQAIVKAAHQRLHQKFDVRTMGEETARVYEELVDSSRLAAGSWRGGARELAVR